MDNTTTTTDKTPAEFKAALAAYIELLDARAAQHYAAKLPNLKPCTYSVDPRGKKYLRIVRTDGNGVDRCVHVFVEVSTGLIWKADGWKAPALNFPRGSIYDLAKAPTGVYGL